MGSPSTPRFFSFLIIFLFPRPPTYFIVKNSSHFNIPGWDGERKDTVRMVGDGLALHSNE